MTVLVVCLTILQLGYSSSFDPALSVYKNSLEELGHQLFFDKTLSNSGNTSCAHCHEPKLAFTDGYRKSFNEIGEELQMNSPTLLNLKERKSFNWAHPEITSLTQQIKGPLFNNHPDELGYYKQERKC